MTDKSREESRASFGGNGMVAASPEVALEMARVLDNYELDVAMPIGMRLALIGTLREFAASKDIEKELRELWWLNHGCSIAALYGDDGEMQCSNHRGGIDFKREPLDDLRKQVHELKLRQLMVGQ